MIALVEFLNARLRDDDELARIIEDGDHWHGIHVDSVTEVAVHVERHDPARVLREVEAKRRIIALHSDRRGRDPSCSSTDYPENAEDCETLRLLALPDADHPDYDERWRS